MTRSDTIGNLATALVAAQAELKNPAFDSKNPHFKNSYASLQSVRDTVTPILAKHGLAVTQLLGASEHGPTCETMLVHKSGEFLSSTLSLPVDRANAQGYGSTFSYARRYALMAIVNVVGEPDDDGNQASEKPARPAAGYRISALKEAAVELTVERKELVERVREQITPFLEKGEYEEAYYIIDMAEFDADERVALANGMDSKHRNGLKKAGELARSKASEAIVTTLHA